MLAGYARNLVLVSKVIFALLPVKTGLVLSLDRTNWKFGEVNINILMLGVIARVVSLGGSVVANYLCAVAKA